MNSSDVYQLIGGALFNCDNEINIERISQWQTAKEGDIVFLFKGSPPQKTTHASMIVTHKKLDNTNPQIVHDNPKLAMQKLLETMHPFKKNVTGIVSDKAVISSSAKIQHPVDIQSFSSIGSNTTISNKTWIATNVTIGSHCKIGKQCIIYPNVVIYDNVTIGDHSIIHSGTVIGADGFGYVNDNGKHMKMSHKGAVVIGSNVEVGANSAIDRGCISDTIIEDGVKIDNLVQVAHNCVIKSDTVVASMCAIGGSVTIGKNSIIAGRVTIKDNISIGDSVVVLGMSGVSKDITSGSIVSGFPAQNHRDELKHQSKLKQLSKKPIEKNK